MRAIDEVGNDKSSTLLAPGGKDSTWSPDGNWIAFRDGDTFYEIRPDGRDKRKLLRRRDVYSPLWWSPDSRFVAYVASVPFTAPPPSRLSTDFPVSPVIRFPSPPISRRGDEDFSSCLAHPCHRAAAATPPECLAASVSLRRAMLPSPHEERLGLWGFRFEATYAFTRCGPMTRSLSFRRLRR